MTELILEIAFALSSKGNTTCHLFAMQLVEII